MVQSRFAVGGGCKRSLGQPPRHAKRDAVAAVAPERVALVPAERCCWLGGHAGQKPSPGNNRPKRTRRPAPPGVRTDGHIRRHKQTPPDHVRRAVDQYRLFATAQAVTRSPGSPPPRPQSARPHATRGADYPQPGTERWSPQLDPMESVAHPIAAVVLQRMILTAPSATSHVGGMPSVMRLPAAAFADQTPCL